MSPARLAVALFPMALLTALSGCSGSTSRSSTPGPSRPPAASVTDRAQPPAVTQRPATAPTAALTIRIKDFMYTVPASVKGGSTLTVINQDSEAHTVTVRRGSTVTVPAGATTHLTAPIQPGSYAITCDFHGNMHATLVVSQS